jgi:hypothetical protein
MLKFCNIDINRTMVQLVHRLLVNVPGMGTKPCHFHTREGVRVMELGQLTDLARGAAAVVFAAVGGVGECMEGGTLVLCN